MAETSPLNAELERLRSRGVVLPKHPGRAVNAFGQSVATTQELVKAAGTDLQRMGARLGRPITAENYDSPEVQSILKENNALVRAMGEKRRNSRDIGTGPASSNLHMAARMTSNAGGLQKVGLQGMPGSGIGGDVYAAIPRFYDPLEYWDLSGLPWNIADEGHRHKLHKWMRLYYATHYLVPILVDIFTRFPLVGMELESKDPEIKEIYEDMFFDQLDYGEFFVNLGREFWCVGEAFPLGSFDPDLAVWEHEELINPEDVVIENFPMLGEKELKIVPPDYLKRLAQMKDPAKEYRQLEINYPDLIPYLLKGEHIPISDVLLRHVSNNLTDWDDHGTPILLRGLRTLLHEEKLLASQDAIAERLYSPLILAKLGIMDMGDGMPPFIPGPEELEAVRDDFDIALSSDFRLLVHHFGLEVTSVFGREQMPRLGDDFDRVERRLMQVFGVNPSLLSAGSATQPYASSALQAEFLNQILKTFQNTLKRHFRDRALVVAEAQGHHDYERKGQTRIPLYETIVEYDMEGNKTFKEVPKLLIPEMKFATLDLRDEATERQFLQSLRQMGVPIPDQDLMVGVSWKIKDKIDTYNEELKEKTISQQRAKFDTYASLVAQGLPVPLDLKNEVESVLNSQGPPPAGGGGMGGDMGGGGPGPAAGPGGDVVMPPPPPGIGAPGVQPQLGPGGFGGTPPGGGPPPTGPMQPGPPGTVPQVSNERRPGLTYNTRRTAAQDTPLGDLLYNEPQLGVPFTDYVVENTADEGVDYDHLDKVSQDELDRLLGDWPNHQRHYEARVAAEIIDHFTYLQEQSEAATIHQASDEEEEEEVNDEDWDLRHNQELKQAEGGLPKRILEKKSNKKIVVDYPKEKKYSIVNPEAKPLEDDSNKEEEETT